MSSPNLKNYILFGNKLSEKERDLKRQRERDRERWREREKNYDDMV